MSATIQWKISYDDSSQAQNDTILRTERRCEYVTRTDAYIAYVWYVLFCHKGLPLAKSSWFSPVWPDS